VTGRVLLVAPGRPGAHATIAGALLSASDGALIHLAAGTYAEELVITSSVTLAAEGGPVRVHAPGGSAIVAEAAVRLSGLAVSGEDPEAPVIDVRGGVAELDGCRISGRAWAAVLARDSGTVSLRDCEIGNDYGAGIVIASAGGNVVADAIIRDVASSGIVVAGEGRLTLLRARLERPGGNGIIVNGQAHLVAEDTSVTGAVRPAVAVEEDAGADLTRLAVVTDTGPGAYLAGQGEITLAGCSFQVRDVGQPAVLVADGAVARCQGLRVTGGAAGILVEHGAVLTLADSDVSADGDGIQVLDGGALTATHSRVNGEGGRGLNVAPDGHADVASCAIDLDDHPGVPAPVPPERVLPEPEVTERAVTEPAEPELAVPGPVVPGPVVPGPVVPGPVLSQDAAPAEREPEPDPAADLELTPSVRLIGDLVGLDGVRQAVSGRLAALMRLRGRGQPFGTEANLAFAGPDGSGRRAVAELYARALAELGFLRTGALDWSPLTDFPARQPGQAGRYADWLLTRSHGGLLFLEADGIFWQWPEDQRTGVLAAVGGAVRRFPDAVIVLSGEPGLLPAALRDPPELGECFPVHVRFDPYTPAELAELTVRRLTARGCDIGHGVRAALAGYFREAEATVVSGAVGAWDAHRLAVYLDEVAPGPEITPADVFSVMRGELDDIPTEAA
jgi:Right handed beta helix region